MVIASVNSKGMAFFIVRKNMVHLCKAKREKGYISIKTNNSVIEFTCNVNEFISFILILIYH